MSFVGSFVGILLALAAVADEVVIYFVVGALALGLTVWFIATLAYILSGQWEIDRRLRSL
jgi:hypothetical protein